MPELSRRPTRTRKIWQNGENWGILRLSGKGKGESPALNIHTAVESWPKEANCKYPGPAGGGGEEQFCLEVEMQHR